jgi:hypothetical protein
MMFIFNTIAHTALAAAARSSTESVAGSVGTGRNLGGGVTLLIPTGFTLKNFLQKESAVDAAVGWSDDNIYLHGDYLLQHNHLATERGYSLNLHYGIGGRLLIATKAEKYPDGRKKEKDNRLGFRFPVGLDVTTGKLNIELFGEMAFIMDFIKETRTELGVAVGGRYYF